MFESSHNEFPYFMGHFKCQETSVEIVTEVCVEHRIWEGVENTFSEVARLRCSRRGRKLSEMFHSISVLVWLYV